METPNIHKLFNIFTPTPNKDVDLVLSSGGARGLAHIGAILALEERGYCIHSVAGASMGALIGGIYATGHLAEYRKWMRTIDRRKIFSLTDFSLGINHIVKGDRIIDAIKQFVPDQHRSAPHPLPRDSYRLQQRARSHLLPRQPLPSHSRLHIYPHLFPPR